jgi:hypothetical protein
MTTQQTPKDFIDGIAAYINDREAARASAQALALQWQAKADMQRTTIERLEAQLTEARRHIAALAPAPQIEYEIGTDGTPDDDPTEWLTMPSPEAVRAARAFLAAAAS